MSGKLSYLFLLALPLAIACGDKDDDTGDAADDTADDGGPDMANGEVIFGQTCANCHGADGDEGDAPDLSEKVPTHDEASLTDIVKNGTGYMSPVSITDDEIADVVSYALYTFQ